MLLNDFTETDLGLYPRQVCQLDLPKYSWQIKGTNGTNINSTTTYLTIFMISAFVLDFGFLKRIEEIYRFLFSQKTGQYIEFYYLIILIMI